MSLADEFVDVADDQAGEDFRREQAENRRAERAPLPEAGQLWADGLSLGFGWLVVGVDEARRVDMVMVDAEGRATDAFMRWPLDRWPALVVKQALSLEAAPE